MKLNNQRAGSGLGADYRYDNESQIRDIVRIIREGSQQERNKIADEMSWWLKERDNFYNMFQDEYRANQNLLREHRSLEIRAMQAGLIEGQVSCPVCGYLTDGKTHQCKWGRK